MIKAFLNLCLLLFLDSLAYMLAVVAAAAVTWAAICGARWIFTALRNAVVALWARQRKKGTCTHATR